MSQSVFRFAPSPNGLLHLGHAASALWNEREAASRDGKLLLRLEDIDRQRSRPEFAEAIIEDMAWLGVPFTGPIRRQSEHFDDYAQALSRLEALDLVYRCGCSRGEIRRRDPAARFGKDPDGAPIYPGLCREGGRPEAEAMAGRSPAWRLDMGKALVRAPRPLEYVRFDPQGRETIVQARPQRWGDVVLGRAETPTSYHLSVVVDDAIQGVTHVVRGEDLEAATDVHVLLQRLLGLPTPRYMFHPLVLDEEERKLSKSRGSTSLRDLIAEGATPASIRRELGIPPPR